MAAHLPRGKAILPISFFKIILKTNLQTLKIPNKFTQRYEGGLSNPVFLKTRDGIEWEVYWTKQNGEVWFQKGWKEFAENYSLDHGYMVVFEYEGASKFDVVIFGQSTLEIDYPSCGGEMDNLLGHQIDDEPVEILDEWSAQKTEQNLLSPPPHKKVRGEGPSWSLNWPKEARAQEVAEAFISQNPFFIIVIKPADKHRKYVPADLEGYVERKDKYVKLQIGERSWDVMLLNTPIYYRQFSAGWNLFAKENELRPEDVCVFELINREDPTFKVHVYKHTVNLSSLSF